MLKMIFLCRRRPDITRERYAELVLGGHAPLALRHHPTLRRYVINIAEATPLGAPELDSLPALYFDDLESYRERLYDSPEGEAIIHADVEKFMASADAYATSEQVHRDAGETAPLRQRSPGVKWVCPLQRHAGMTRERFVERWLEDHVPLLLGQVPGVIRYTTSLVDARLSPTGDEWDAFAEIHFAQPRDAESMAVGHYEGAAAIAESRARLLTRELRYPVAEYVQK